MLNHADGRVVSASSTERRLAARFSGSVAFTCLKRRQSCSFLKVTCTLSSHCFPTTDWLTSKSIFTLFNVSRDVFLFGLTL